MIHFIEPHTRPVTEQPELIPGMPMHDAIVELQGSYPDARRATVGDYLAKLNLGTGLSGEEQRAFLNMRRQVADRIGGMLGGNADDRSTAEIILTAFGTVGLRPENASSSK